MQPSKNLSACHTVRDDRIYDRPARTVYRKNRSPQMGISMKLMVPTLVCRGSDPFVNLRFAGATSY